MQISSIINNLSNAFKIRNRLGIFRPNKLIEIKVGPRENQCENLSPHFTPSGGQDLYVLINAPVAALDTETV